MEGGGGLSTNGTGRMHFSFCRNCLFNCLEWSHRALSIIPLFFVFQVCENLNTLSMSRKREVTNSRGCYVSEKGNGRVPYSVRI